MIHCLIKKNKCNTVLQITNPYNLCTNNEYCCIDTTIGDGVSLRKGRENGHWDGPVINRKKMQRADSIDVLRNYDRPMQIQMWTTRVRVAVYRVGVWESLGFQQIHQK